MNTIRFNFNDLCAFFSRYTPESLSDPRSPFGMLVDIEKDLRPKESGEKLGLPVAGAGDSMRNVQSFGSAVWDWLMGLLGREDES